MGTFSENEDDLHEFWKTSDLSDENIFKFLNKAIMILFKSYLTTIKMISLKFEEKKMDVLLG